MALIIYSVYCQKQGPTDKYQKAAWNDTSVGPNEVEGLELSEYTLKEGTQRFGEMGVLQQTVR